MKDVVRFLAAWALVHESADEAWKAAVARGVALTPHHLERGPDAFVDGLAALVAEEKERLKRELAGDREKAGAEAEGAVAGAGAGAGERGDAVAAQLEALRFELAELRGRIESLQASVDALGVARED